MTAVGIPLRPFTGEDFPPKLALNRAYFEALDAAGATVVPIPSASDVERLRFHYELLDAIVFPGGADVEPRRYGAVAREDCHLTLMPELDEVELALARWALADDLPILAICRGIQLLNVACGGTLWQDLKVEGVTVESHDRSPRDLLAHDLDIVPGSVLARTVGRARIRVNTIHHQAIRRLGDALVVAGNSSDGLVEAVEMPGHRFVVGIQCHPEELRSKEDWPARLFEALVAAGAERRPAGSPVGSHLGV
ncbi:MAG: gamma-glutamyl-gamma-aminobutyrate hydrolase family protein [Candidatus Dormibacterales bacterium]